MLQPVCCGALQWCSLLSFQPTNAHARTLSLRYVGVCWSVLQCVAVCFNVLQCCSMFRLSLLGANTTKIHFLHSDFMLITTVKTKFTFLDIVLVLCKIVILLCFCILFGNSSIWYQCSFTITYFQNAQISKTIREIGRLYWPSWSHNVFSLSSPAKKQTMQTTSRTMWS